MHVCQTSDKHCKDDYRQTENEIVQIRNIPRGGTSAEGTGGSIRTSRHSELLGGVVDDIKYNHQINKEKDPNATNTQT